jgi:hypothetical protein
MAAQTGGGPADDAPAKTGAWGLLILLTVINVLNFVDRQLLPSFANFIKPDLGLTDTQFGLLTGLFFIIFYAVAGLFMGVLAGAWGPLPLRHRSQHTSRQMLRMTLAVVTTHE